jgi:predicted alpha/beta hydrolase family esterase
LVTGWYIIDWLYAFAFDMTLLLRNSTGCQAILRYLAQLGPVGGRVGGVLLVAVWFAIDKVSVLHNMNIAALT